MEFDADKFVRLALIFIYDLIVFSSFIGVFILSDAYIDLIVELEELKALVALKVEE